MIRRARICAAAVCVLAVACRTTAPGGPSPEAAPDRRAAPSVVLTPQFGHAGRVTALAFSTDGNYLFTGGLDRSIKVWDLESRTLLRTIRGHGGPVLHLRSFGSAEAGPGGLVSLSSDGTIRVWSVESGVERARYASEAAFGRLEVGGGVLWASRDQGEAIAARLPALTLTASVSTDKTWVLGLSATGRWLRIGPDRDEVEVGDFRSGHTIRLPGRAYPRAAGWSADGRTALFADNDGTLEVWDTETGRRERRWRPARRSPVNGIAVSPRGRWAVVKRADGRATVWSLSDARPARELGTVGGVAFSAGGRRIAAVDEDTGEIRVTPTGGGAAVRVGGLLQTPAVAHLSASGEAVSLAHGSFQRWRLDRLVMTASFESTASNLPGAVAFSADGGTAITGHVDYPQRWVELWDLREERRVKRLATPVAPSRVVALPGGRFVVAATDNTDLAIHLMDREGGLKSIDTTIYPVSVAVTPDGRRLVTGDADGRVRAWDVATVAAYPEVKVPAAEALVATLDRHEGWVWSVAVSADGRTAVSGGEGGRVIAWDIDSGRADVSIDAHGGRVTALALSSDGTRLATGGDDGRIGVFDRRSGRRLAELAGHTSTVESLALDREWVLSGSGDGTLRYTRWTRGVSVAMVAGHRWIVFSDDGYFDASRDGGPLVAAVAGMRAFRIEQLAVRNNRPDLLLERLGVGSPALRAELRARYGRRLERLGLDERALSDGFSRGPVAQVRRVQRSGRRVELTIRAEGQGAPVSAWTVFVNGVPVEEATLPSPAPAVERSVSFALGAGPNEVEVSALDAAGRESARARRVIDGPSSEVRRLVFIGFGVSKYAHPDLDLGYADRDALDLARALRRAPGFEERSIRVFVDEEVTEASISAARDVLETTDVDDLVVLFIAGHGAYTRGSPAEYVFLGHEADPDRLAQTAVPFARFEALLSATPSRSKLLLMDTCASGERDGPRATARISGASARTIRGVTRASSARPWLFDRERFIYTDLSRRTGAVVLSSSRGEEVSYEFERLENGAFTEVLLEALRSARADVDGDGRLSPHELRAFLYRGVAALTENRQHPTIDRDNPAARVALPLIP